MESSLVEASPVERNGLVGVAEKRTQPGGLIASQHTLGTEAFHNQAGYTGRRCPQVRINK
jgi:hypothetical protein